MRARSCPVLIFCHSLARALVSNRSLYLALAIERFHRTLYQSDVGPEPENSLMNMYFFITFHIACYKMLQIKE